MLEYVFVSDKTVPDSEKMDGFLTFKVNMCEIIEGSRRLGHEIFLTGSASLRHIQVMRACVIASNCIYLCVWWDCVSGHDKHPNVKHL